MKLYTYYRSSAAYRVRIALNLKGLPWEAVPVHLARGEQHQDGYRNLNPAGLVPALDDGGQLLTQSLAIIEYLDETHPEPALLPGDALARARIRALAQSIACDIHPINNLRVLQYLSGELGVSEAQKNAWYRHWIERGLEAFERTLEAQGTSGRYCVGDTPTLADVCLVPQVYNARRFDSRIEHLPNVLRIVAECDRLDAFSLAAPERQADAS